MTTLMKRWVGAGCAAVATVAALSLSAGSAWACGGLFCNSSSPVNQAAERIIFVDRPDGTVTAVVEIQYQGSADQFSWVLPVPGIPEIGVSSTMALNRLQQATNPVYRLLTETEGQCAPTTTIDESDDLPSDPDSDRGGDVGVDVVGAGTVGPFDFEIISVDPGLYRATDVAVQWLEENGYDVTPQTRDLLGPYLEDGMNLVGFRLTNGADVESIRPIMMTYETDDPMIPIRPTAVAANDDMGVMVFNVAPGRAVPSNYRHLVLNEAAINWFRPNSNYRDVVNLAADEAGGQGFVTEMATRSSDFNDTIIRGFEAAEVRQFRARSAEASPVEMVYLAHSFARWDGYVDAFRLAWSGDDDVQELIACPECFFIPEEGVIPDFDVATFLTAMDDFVFGPMERTQSLLVSMPYLTRFFTTMSAFEMTKDPIFKVNRDLPDISNVHTNTRTILCNPDVEDFQAPWRVVFDGVELYQARGNVWPVELGQVPANRRVEQLSDSGSPEVVVDNTELIQQDLIEAGLGAPRPVVESEEDMDDVDGEQSTDGGGCAISSGQSPARSGGAVVFLLGFVALGLRRRGRFLG